MIDIYKHFNSYDELKAYLNDEGVNCNGICIGKGPNNDLDFSIHDDGDAIKVYWIERGIKFDYREFKISQKPSAIEYFLQLIYVNINLFR